MSANATVRTETQFSLFLSNRPGVLQRIAQQLAGKKVNIIALSMMDSTEHGVLRLVCENPDLARRALAELDLPKTETTILTVTLPNRPGALADVVERLAAETINVHYAYCTTGARGGNTLGVFKVSNVTKAQQVLGERKPRRRPVIRSPRRPAAARR